MDFIITHTGSTSDEIQRAFDETFDVPVTVTVSDIKTDTYGKRYRSAYIHAHASSQSFRRFVANIQRDGYDIFTANHTDYRVMMSSTPTSFKTFTPRIA